MADTKQNFVEAQQRMLNRYEVETKSRFIEVPSISGRAHVLVSGEGPAVVMVNGIGTPAAMWAPLMAELTGLQVFAVDLPAYGLTDTTNELTENLRRNAVLFLEEVIDQLKLDQPAFIANSMGSLWTSWLALDRPERVAAMVHIGCPAVVLDTSAPLQMRLLSVKPIGRLLTWLQPPSEKQVEELSRMVNEYPFTPELADLLLATEQLPGFRKTFLSTLNTLLRLGGSRPDMRLTAKQLKQLEQPTMLFWGRSDPFGSPKVGQRMADILPNAKLHVVGGGHAPWLTQAEQIAQVTTPFLQKFE
ncbi:alpha/beta hydrolase [Aliifodinibius sp. S!AR15-10]|uniref:alpha/beta fold hydrolase n=1 Tax=Aliifodinibius sp. S!AR15-10 TaxID=2950437 RepID=UPI0028672C92|nr:alpha/beta hydrolase [Aliifodinibius sp. S!AR15-10]MDR8393923.1 alpha/beta hydrolase [Aliifodinibius sp. S!AR15-10]